MISPNLRFGRGRRRWSPWRLLALALVLAFVCGLGVQGFRQSAEPVIPFPNLLVTVKTTSGTVTRTSLVPIGGVPIPIDVDNGRISGLLQPDIDVSIPVLELNELPNGLTRVVQPQIVVRRHFLAPIRRAPAPSLKIEAHIQILNLNGGPDLANITYGFETPGGSRMPPVVHARLTSPLEGGFVDPLAGVIESPGYNGPLNFDVRAKTPEIDAQIALDFDPLPERIEFEQDPTDTGMELHYEHAGDVPDVQLDADVSLTKLPSRDRLAIGALVERVPRKLDVGYGSADGRTLVDFSSVTPLRKPDIGAAFSDVKGDGTVATDANVKVSGLAPKLTAELRNDDAGELSKVDFQVLDGEKIDAVEFLARNWTGDPGPVPEPDLGPDQYVAVATRPMPDGSSRFRAAGLMRDLRSATVELDGGTIDATTDLGDGVRPLRTLLDFDDRAGGEGSHLDVDATVSPLPRHIHARYEDGTAPDPLRILYEAEQAVDVDASFSQTPATGDRIEATARVDRLPSRIDVSFLDAAEEMLIDFDSDQSAGKPDVAATFKSIADDGTLNVDASADLKGLPERMAARMAFAPLPPPSPDNPCDDDQTADAKALTGVTFDAQGGELDRLEFLARNYPAGQGSVPEPELDEDQRVAVATRPVDECRSLFRAAGRIEDLRSGSFEQVDLGSEADGTDRQLVDATADIGDGQKPLRAVLDFDSRAAGDCDGDRDGADDDRDATGSRLNVDTTISPLPQDIHATFDPGAGDDPLRLRYSAAQEPEVEADLSQTGACGELLEAKARIDKLPSTLDFSYLDGDDGMLVDFDSDFDGAKPNVEADVRQVAADGTVGVDLSATVDGLPERMLARLGTKTLPEDPDDPCDTDADDEQEQLTGVSFEVPDGGQIDSVDFRARNWTGDPGPVPEVDLTEDQRIAVATRRVDECRSLFLAEGRLEAIRSGSFQKTALGSADDDSEREAIDASADLGNGVKPLRAVLDFDDRADCEDGDSIGSRTKVDATVTPLPRPITARFDPGGGPDPLRVTYESDQPTQVDADFSSLGACGELLEAEARVEGVPSRIDFSYLDGDEEMLVDFESDPGPTKPNVNARVRSVAAGGVVNLDAVLDVDGLPPRMTARLGFEPLPSDDPCNEDGEGKALTGIDFDVPDVAGTPVRDEIDAIEFLARNWTGDPGPVPEVELSEDQRIAVATRRVDECRSLFRAAGRLEKIRSATYESIENDPDKADDDGIDATVDAGNGVKPLRAVADFDGRGDGAPDDASRFKLDTTITPLPGNIHARYEPAAGEEPLKVLYESGAAIDADADVLIAGDKGEGCGDEGVTCATATVDDIPSRIELELPGEGSDDVLVSHTGSAPNLPDASATVDLRPEDDPDTDEAEDKRTYVEAALDDLPREIRGRLDFGSKVRSAAEFHACTWDFAQSKCTDTQGQIGSVDFTMRDRPDRRGLPPAPAASADPFATVLGRGDRLEISGRVEQIRHVEFQQRLPDDDGDGAPDAADNCPDLANADQKNSDDDVLGDACDPDDDTADPDATLEPGSALGTLGARVDAGSGDEFNVKVDTLDGDEASRVDVKVHDLPEDFSTCIRENREEEPPDPDDLSDSELLGPCDRTDVLGRDEGELESTPLSLVYKAKTATQVTADVDTQAPNPDDRNRAGVQRIHADVQNVPAGITRADVISPVTPDEAGDVDGRKLELQYVADKKIDEVDFDMETRRASSFCADPRADRKATCLSTTIKDVPKTLTATYDPDPEKGDIDFRTQAPAVGDDALSIDPIELSLVDDKEDDPGVPANQDAQDAPPTVASATITGLTAHLTGKLQQLDLTGEDPEGAAAANPPQSLAARLATCSDNVDNDDKDGKDGKDPDCKAELAQIAFDACPDGGTCTGIDKIEFKAATTREDVNASTADDLIPAPPASTATQKLAYVQRGDHFRASGTIDDLRKVRYSRVDDDGELMDTTLMSAALGSTSVGQTIHAYVDADDGKSATKLDTLVKEAPSAIDLCLRPAVAKAAADSPIWCEEQDAESTAIQAVNRGTGSPDIEVSELRLAQGGGIDTIAGSATVKDLAKRIDVLTGADGSLEIEGHNAGDGDNAAPVEVAGRITADIRNFGSPKPRCSDGADNDGDGKTDFKADGSGDPECADRGDDVENDESFPFGPYEERTDPDKDARNKDSQDQKHNYVKLATQESFFGSRDGFRIQASVPAVKRVAMRPEACASDDPRFPDAADYAEADRPSYTCINVIAAQSRPLGIAVRDVKSDPKLGAQLLALEEGHIDSVPGGSDGLSITQATTPSTIKLAPACSIVDMTDRDVSEDPCQPPMLDVHAPKSASQESRLLARIATGNSYDLKEARQTTPSDVLSKRLDYERDPTKYGAFGIRVKVAAPAGEGPSIRIGAHLKIPDYLSLDPPVIFSCKHDDLTVDLETDSDQNGQADDCESDDVGTTKDTRGNVTEGEGYKTGDTFFKVVASSERPDQSEPDDYVDSLGRVAVFVDPRSNTKGDSEIVLTGTPPPNNRTPQSPAQGDRNIQGASSGGVERAYRHPGHTVDGNGFEQVGACSSPQTCATHESLLSDLGFKAPGHIDARIYTREDLNYRPNDPTDTRKLQQGYTQVDGRTSKPLSLGVRISDVTEKGTNRDGDRVASMNLNARNLPALASGQTGFDLSKPTFRIRAELSNRNPPPPKHCLLPQYGGQEGVEAYLGCATLPVKPILEWLDVNVNADPGSDGSSTTTGAARTIDVVGNLFGATNDVDLRGFKDVDGQSGTHSKGPVARFTPQAGLRMTDVDVGLINFFATEHVTLDNDAIIGVAGNVDHLRLSHAGAQLGLLAQPSDSDATAGYVETDFRSRVDYVRTNILGVVEANVSSARQDVNIRLKDCRGTFGQDLGSASDINLFHTRLSDFEVEPAPRVGPPAGITDLQWIWGSLAFISTDFPHGSEFSRAVKFLADATSIVNPILCTQGSSEPQSSFNDLVTTQHPAPAYALTERPLDGGVEADTEDVDPPPAPGPAPAAAPDVNIATNTTLCGRIQARNFTVASGVTVTVGGGGSGSTPQQVDHPYLKDAANNPVKVDCNGTLGIDADSLSMGTGAKITASGKADRFSWDDPRTTEDEGNFSGPGFTSAIGGGAGHHGLGGLAGGSSGTRGPSYDVPAAGPIADLGSLGDHGGSGSTTAAGGKGGGAIEINARRHIAMGSNARIEANGGDGEAQSGCFIAGGGGSGGHVALSALRIKGDHSGSDASAIEAKGGKGGNGVDRGGGGGSGGRVTVNGVVREPPVHVGGGAGGKGDTTTGCISDVDGGAGDDGNYRGDNPHHRAEVKLHSDNTGPFTKNGTVKLDYIAAKQQGGENRLFAEFCWKKLPANTTEANPLQSPTLNPPANSLTELSDPIARTAQLTAYFSGFNGQCVTRTLSPDTNDDGDFYSGTVDVPSLGEGFYGFFALATYGNHVLASSGDPTVKVPQQKSVRLGIDRTAPALTSPVLLNGSGSCPFLTSGWLCLGENGGKYRFGVSEQMSGLASSKCFLAIPSGREDACEAGKDETYTFPKDHNGRARLNIDLTDGAGNVQHATVGTWFVDRLVPEKPVLTVNTGAASATNGWFRQKPTVQVDAVDKGPSGGFEANAITFYADTAANRCGGRADGIDEIGSTTTKTTCFIGETQSFTPNEGEHELSAESVDKLGNPSPRSDSDATKPGSQPFTMRVDQTAPTSRLFLGPEQPDGENGTYRTRPTFAFTTVDAAGGSGVDPSKAPSGVKFKVVNATDAMPTTGFQAWDPGDDQTNRVPDGEKKVCWFATDVAGNPEATKCSGTLKVDSLPDSQLLVHPPQPDGDGSYLDRPHFEFAARTPGGPWVDFTKPGPEVRFEVLEVGETASPATFGVWDPDEEQSNRLPVGKSLICWFVKDGSDEEPMHCEGPFEVDPPKPQSRLVVQPSEPDGEDGAYRVPPNFRFTASLLGEPVDFSKPDPRVRYRIFPNQTQADAANISTYSTWDPDAFDSNKLNGLTNVICWFAIVDGRQEAKQCSGVVEVEDPRPISRLVVEPGEPDGEGGWYGSRPHFRFTATLAREPVDFSIAGPVVKYKFFNSTDAVPASTADYLTWTPSSFTTNRVPDGLKKVCWFATIGVQVEAKRCSSEIKVDSQAPTVADTIAPAAPNGQDSFYVTTPTVKPTGADTGGSGLNRVEYRIDGGAWTLATVAGFGVAEGRHLVEERSADNAGNRSQIKRRQVFVDKKKPLASVGTFPPEPNEQGWFRQRPTVSIAASDGRDGSGADGATYKLDAAPFAPYASPFSLGEGAHTLQVKPRDHAGLVGDPQLSQPKVDLTAPVAKAIGIPRPILLLNQTVLEAYVTDTHSTRVKARIVVFNTFGQIVRELPVNGPHPGGYSGEGRLKVKWDGRDERGRGVLPGIYYHRVQATDQAGNTVMSSEGQTFLVILGVLPL